MRKCTKCQQSKDESEFTRHVAKPSGFHSWCKKCNNESQRKWYRKNNEREILKSRTYRQKNPIKTKNTKLKQKYGISIEDFNSLLASQNGVCAICSKIDNYKHSKGSNTPLLSVDHSHLTGKIRGLLCGSCNRAIGLLKDSTYLLHNAIKYLEGKKCES